LAARIYRRQLVAKFGEKKSKIIGLELQLSLLRGSDSAEMVEKVGTSNTRLVQ
jgi:hypothetical protein